MLLRDIQVADVLYGLFPHTETRSAWQMHYAIVEYVTPTAAILAVGSSRGVCADDGLRPHELLIQGQRALQDTGLSVPTRFALVNRAVVFTQPNCAALKRCGSAADYVPAAVLRTAARLVIDHAAARARANRAYG